MSVDREYRIKISTVTEGDSGVAAQGLRETGKSAEKAGEDFKLLETKGREFHELGHKLNELMPGLGTAIRAAFNPQLIGISALILLIEGIKSAIEGYKEKLKEMEEAAAKADFAEGIIALRDAIRDSIDSADEFKRKQQEILDGEDGIIARLTTRLSLLAAIKAAGESEADAQKTLAIARIQQDEALGRITQSQAIEAKAAVERASLDRKNRDEESEFAKEQNARVNAENEARQKRGDLAQKELDAQAELDQAKKNQALAKGAPTNDDVQKAQQAADEALTKFQQSAATAGIKNAGITTPIPSDIEMTPLQEEARRLQQKADQLESLFRQAQSANAVDIKALENALKTAQDATTKNTEAIAKLSAENKKAIDEHNATAGARAGALGASESAVDVQAKTELLRRGRELQQEFERNGIGGMSRNDLNELLGAITMLHEQVLQQGRDKVTPAQFKAEIDALKRKIETMGK